jgi:hypothetical protein
METSRLDGVRSRVRRVQLMLAVGFFAMIVGMLITSAISNRLEQRPHQAWSWITGMVLYALIVRLWCWAVLPSCCYLLARVVPVSRRGLPVGAALVGEGAHQIAIWLGPWGMGLYQSRPEIAVVHLVTLALGILLSMRAITTAQSAVAREQEKAKVSAQARADEYAAMLRESEKLAEKNAQRGSGTGTGP